MAELLTYVEDREHSEFYPTPDALAGKMVRKVDWKKVESVLEPSAGKGDVLKAVAKQVRKRRREHAVTDIDAIEIDPNLRAILKHNFSREAREDIQNRKDSLLRSKGCHTNLEWESKKYCYLDNGKYQYFPDDEQEMLKEYDDALEGFFEGGIHIVHDDFLTYTDYTRYSLIIMNPPFSCGDRHLLKAIDMQKEGGQIVCVLNAETIRNPYTAVRKCLRELLDRYEADVEYISGAFTGAERKADVDVALIYINIPYTEPEGESIYEKLTRAKAYREPTPEQAMELEVTDFIPMIVNRYRVEVESGIELIRTYQRMVPYLNSYINPEKQGYYNSSLILLKDGNGNHITINSYVRSVRLKYWHGLLTNEKFIGKLTSKLQKEYGQRVSSYADYDFSEFNIYMLLTEMNTQIIKGIKDEIEVMYDRLTEEHSYYPECKKNRYLYNGWKTNKAWKLEKKSILPCYDVFSQWNKEPNPRSAFGVLSDIERILNFFDGNSTLNVSLASAIEANFNRGNTKNIRCKFFTVTFYKKGTVHIVYNCPELIDRFNIYCARNRRWLPPSYGTKKYDEMNAEERAVIDSFQGRQAYEEVMKRPEYYLAPPVSKEKLMMISSSEISA